MYKVSRKSSPYNKDATLGASSLEGYRRLYRGRTGSLLELYRIYGLGRDPFEGLGAQQVGTKVEARALGI